MALSDEYQDPNAVQSPMPAENPQNEPLPQGVASFAPAQQMSSGPPPMTMANSQPPATIAYPGASPMGPADQGQPAPQLAMMPGTGGPRKAGFQPNERTTKTSSKTSPYSDEADRSALESIGTQRDLSQAELEAGGAQGETQRQANKSIEAFDFGSNVSNDLRAQRQARDVHDYHAKIDGLLKDASNYHEDPMKWFHDESSGGKIATVLGAIVSGFGFGYSGRGVNPVDVIENRIRHSVESQRNEHQGKIGEIGEAKGQLADLRQQFGDDQSAALASQAAKRQYIISHLQAVAGDASAPAMSRLAAAKANAGLQDYQRKTLEELDTRRLSTIEQTGSEKYQPAQAAGGGEVGVPVTLQDGRRVVISAQKAKELGLLPGNPLEQRKLSAETRKTEAEAATLESKVVGAKAPYKTLEDSIAKMKSVAWDPTRVFQASDAAKHARGLADVKVQMLGAWHSAHPGLRMTPEIMHALDEAYAPKMGDLQSTIEDNAKNFIQSLEGTHAGASGSGTEQPQED